MYFNRYDIAWLQCEMRKFYPDGATSSSGMSPEDICSAVFEMLTLSKSDEELQNDVRMLIQLKF